MDFGSIIGAGASLLGGLFGNNSQEDAMKAQIRAQKQFAQNGIRWRVKDANEAGVHPLFALGAQTTSFSPIGLPGNPLGEGIANAGQQIGRAIDAKSTSGERAFNAKMMQLQLQRGELENAVLASQLARQNSPTQMPPPLPAVNNAGQTVADRYLIDGQASTLPMPIPERFGGPLVVNAPLERIAADPARPSNEPGAITDVGFARTADGGWAPVPSSDVKNRIEDNLVPEMMWNARNLIAPNLTPVTGHGRNPPFAAPRGKEWQWSYMKQAYYLVDRGPSGSSGSW